jgi:hypothetical protein
LAVQLAVESAVVLTEVIEISDLPDLARELAVTSVPRLQVGDRVLLGSQSEISIVDTVLGSRRNHGNV